jgi:hypothetical protein
MHRVVETLQGYPEIAVFLTLALGRLKLGRFSLGNVIGSCQQAY